MSDDKLHQAVGRLEGKVDMILNNCSAHCRRGDDLEGRVRALEHRKARREGFIATVSSVFSFLFGWIAGR